MEKLKNTAVKGYPDENQSKNLLKRCQYRSEIILQEKFERKNQVIIWHPSSMSVYKFLLAESWKHNERRCLLSQKQNHRKSRRRNECVRVCVHHLLNSGEIQTKQNLKEARMLLRTNASAVNPQTGVLNINARLQRMCWKPHRQKIIRELQPAENSEPSFSKD